MSIIERYDPTKDLDEKINSRVHIYNKQTHGRKSITVVVGLDVSKENEKLFLKTSQERLATSGYKKLMPEYADKDESFCFNGDKRRELKAIIHELFGIPKEDIIVH